MKLVRADGRLVIEIRFHGRGGLGAVTASELFAQAAFAEGRYPQAFPFFGVERRGAPVTAFLRLDDHPLSVRTAIAEPDIVVVFERSLLRAVPVLSGLKADGLLLLNTAADPREEAPDYHGRAATVDATAIALRLGLGSASTPIVGTALLGALASSSGLVRRETLESTIRAHLARSTDANVLAAREGFASVRTFGRTLEAIA